MKEKVKHKYENRVTVKAMKPVSFIGYAIRLFYVAVTRNRYEHRNLNRLTLFYTVYAICVLLVFVWGSATPGGVKETSEPQEPIVITSIDIQDYTVMITGNKPFAYTIYRPDDPYKIVVELLGVNIGAFKDKIVSQKAGITEIVPSQVESPSSAARLEMLLQTPSMVEPEYKETSLILRIKEEAPPEPATQPLPEALQKVLQAKEEAQSAPVEQIPSQKATEITNISLEKADDILRVVIKGNGSMTPNIFPLDNRIVIDIPDVVMNIPLPSEIVSPLKGIRSGKHPDKIRLVLDLKEKTSFDVASIEDTIVVAMQVAEKELPVSQVVTPTPEEKVKVEAVEPAPLVEGKYTGKRISLDFQDADIVPIFRLLADISGYNIVVSPEVKGRLTMKLINVPWDQALDLILKTFGLGKSIEGNIIRIAPYTVLAKEAEDAAKAAEAKIKVEPIETKVFPVSYADVSVIESAIKNAKALSARGNLSIDKRTSSIIVKDVASSIKEVESLIKTLDTPTPQVMIEARIVEADTSSVKELGIQWGMFGRTPDGLLTVGGGLSQAGTATSPFSSDNLFVNLPAAVGAGAGGAINLGFVNPARTFSLDLQLSALESAGKGKIISNPRIMTIDNEKATIKQGKSIPVQTTSAEGTKTEYIDMALELTVTPHITPDGSIIMKIESKKNEPDWGNAVAGIPAKDTKEVTTQVLIKDGETLVIGGIFKTKESEAESRVPWFSRLPLLGWLFKKERTEVIQNELLIFITPRKIERT